MTPVSQAEWYDRLVSWYPSWQVIPGGVFAAQLQGLAKMLEAVGEDVEEEFLKTFIDTATADVLDTHGDERSVFRRTSETDATLRIRIKNFALSVTQSDLVAGVNALLPLTTPAQFYDRMTYGQFVESDELFADNEDWFLLSQKRLYNWFYVYIPLLDPVDVLTTDTTIGVGETAVYSYLHVPAGIILTVNGTLTYTKLLLEGTILYGPSSAEATVAPTNLYQQIVDQIYAVKTFGVEFEIWSEAFDL